MAPSSKKKSNRALCITSIIFGIMVLPLFFFFYWLAKKNDYGFGFLIIIIIILAISVLVFGIIGLILSFKKPFIECKEIGIDAKGKRYLEANNAAWFFSNLSRSDIESIKRRVEELEKWRHDEVSRRKTEKEKKKFIDKYNFHSQKAFYCYIYRSGTRYTQSNYVKTPYIGTSEYWSEFYSIESIKRYLK